MGSRVARVAPGSPPAVSGEFRPGRTVSSAPCAFRSLATTTATRPIVRRCTRRSTRRRFARRSRRTQQRCHGRRTWSARRIGVRYGHQPPRRSATPGSSGSAARRRERSERRTVNAMRRARFGATSRRWGFACCPSSADGSSRPSSRSTSSVSSTGCSARTATRARSATRSTASARYTAGRVDQAARCRSTRPKGSRRRASIQGVNGSSSRTRQCAFSPHSRRGPGTVGDRLLRGPPPRGAPGAASARSRRPATATSRSWPRFATI